MNERIKELALEAFQPINDIASEGIADRHTFNQAWFQLYNQKFAELIIKECADYVRTNYDSWDAEPLAFNMEKDFGLHGDYAE